MHPYYKLWSMLHIYNQKSQHEGATVSLRLYLFCICRRDKKNFFWMKSDWEKMYQPSKHYRTKSCLIVIAYVHRLKTSVKLQMWWIFCHLLCGCFNTLTSVLWRRRGCQVTHIVTSLCSWDFHLIKSLTVWRGLDRLKDFIRPLISLIVCSFIPSSPAALITHWTNNFRHHKYHLVSHNSLI